MTGRRRFLSGLAGVGLTAAIRPVRGSDLPEQAPSALSVGVSTYDHIPDLPSATQDAALMAAVFVSLGFRVSMLINPTRAEFMRGLARFGAGAGNAPLTLTYAAAHGGMLNGQSHLFFKDSRTIADRVPETVLLQAMNSQPRQKILFLDSCRESPISGQDDVAPTEQYRAGIHVSYAAQPGAPAIDGENGHSPYANALQAALEMPGLDMFEISRRVRLQVLRATNGLQIPWDRSSLVLPLVLNPAS